ncbi:MAG: M50 family metallopeptidase [Candidatus Dojkabacteria bacterium]|nr:M50 family metallopeptidase [Candidatus Dojkabacteria bacterium]
MDLLFTLLVLLLILGISIFVHELGHFVAAKLARVPVKEFAIGFGKTLFSKTYLETNYKINLIPLGGYVHLEGEHSESTSENSFRNKPFITKTFILISGVTMNLVLAATLLSIYLIANNFKFGLLPKFVDHNFMSVVDQKTILPLNIVDVLPNSNADTFLNVGDVIVSINNTFFTSFEEFLNILNQNIDKNISLGLIDLNTYEIKNISLFIDSKRIIQEKGILGVKFSFNNTQLQTPIFLLEYEKSVFSPIFLTVDLFIYQIKAMNSIISEALQTRDFQKATQSFGGIPAITDQVNTIVQFRLFEVILPFVAFINISLAFINILPIPMLDGGMILIFFIEFLSRKRISDKTISIINLIGFIFLMSLVIFINVKDIIQLGWIESILNFLKSIFNR